MRKMIQVSIKNKCKIKKKTLIILISIKFPRYKNSMLLRKIYNLLSSIVVNFRMQCNEIEIIILKGRFRMKNTGTIFRWFQNVSL